MITKEDLQKLADLSRLNLSDEELNSFETDLSGLVDYVSQLDELDLKDIEPTSQVTGLMNVFREDMLDSKSQEDLLANRELFLKNAAAVQDGFIAVPAVFEDIDN